MTAPAKPKPPVLHTAARAKPKNPPHRPLGRLHPNRKPWETVLYQSVYGHRQGYAPHPIYRGLAWALISAEQHNALFIVTSADRRDSVLHAFHQPASEGQQFLYDHQNEPGFFAANPPDETSHCLRSDGNPLYGPPRGHIPRFKLGIDAVDHGADNDCVKLVAKLNALGFTARRPYPSSGEAHHMSFKYDPSGHARHLVRLFARRHPIAALRYWAG